MKAVPIRRGKDGRDKTRQRQNQIGAIARHDGGRGFSSPAGMRLESPRQAENRIRANPEYDGKCRAFGI
jgi:hypothetical protein